MWFHCVIRLFNAKKTCPIEIYRHITEVYCNVKNEASVRKWCILFNGRPTNIHDEEHSGQPSVVTEKLKSKIEEFDRDLSAKTNGSCTGFSQLVQGWRGIFESHCY